MDKQLPLVSCIMPTYNRRAFVPRAIRYFLQQDYENKELIVIDDGTDAIEDLIPDLPSIRYFRLKKKITLGAKLNMACRYAKGMILANWDDDDWYAPRRLTYQYNILQFEGTDVCGLNKLLYYDLRNHQAYQYIYPPDQRPWLLGSSLCYTRKLWDRNHFADINVGMDGLFVWGTAPNRVTVLSDPTIAVHMIHDSNISPKKTDGGWWHIHPAEEIKQIMQNDWDSYKLQSAPFQNIYACLVHENEECIIDLVRNLHHNDPDSVILLYNGGQNPNLIQKQFLYDQFRAIVHPDPSPVKHGYLHRFALDCMQFCSDRFSFDSMTFVDSDQLATRSGYSQYLGNYFSGVSNVGMLSNKPKRLTAYDIGDKETWPAIEAFKEYDLWRPLLQQFPEGESHFVHWTFWPSSVFTSDAIRDLIKLFQNNRTLQEIMSRSKIWATEEVILPTLIRLLGFEIAANPCSYEFVKYKKSHTIQDINRAMNKTEVYWVHPVARRYDDPLRKQIREQMNHYALVNKTTTLDMESPPGMFSALSLISEIRKIGGWLDDSEADLLITVTLKACKDLPAPNQIVEIGSYQGKTTVLFGSLLKAFFPESRIYSIDTHDGKLGAVDQGLKLYPPSFEKFSTNIHRAGVDEFVDVFKGHSYEVAWHKPISLLFIDGLHDYPSVARDFWHFSEWLRQGAYAVFHDYSDYFPGVKTFVNELLATGAYRKIQLAGSLMVLQKL